MIIDCFESPMKHVAGTLTNKVHKLARLNRDSNSFQRVYFMYIVHYYSSTSKTLTEQHIHKNKNNFYKRRLKISLNKELVTASLNPERYKHRLNSYTWIELAYLAYL